MARRITIEGKNGRVHIDIEIDGSPCRCGGTFSVGYTADGRRQGTVLHSLPPCAKYNELDVNDFLQWSRIGDA